MRLASDTSQLGGMLRRESFDIRREIPMSSPAISSTWLGFAALKHLVIFGASYCDIGYHPEKSPHPTKDNPLGVPFPGVTYNEPCKPNWVGHIVSRYSPDSTTPLLVYDFAVGGSTVPNVFNQIKEDFAPVVGTKPEWARWEATDTLFITFVGINDCAFSSDHVESMMTLFKAQDQLYETGARNFLFIDVPPVDRSPSAPPRGSNRANKSITTWNTVLREHAQLFSTAHQDATVMVFPMWDTFTSVLDNPGVYGFSQDDIRKVGAGIWFDRLHPTSKMHGIMADDIVGFLRG